MSLLIQDIVVTAVTLGFGAFAVRRVLSAVRPERPQCGSCNRCDSARPPAVPVGLRPR